MLGFIIFQLFNMISLSSCFQEIDFLGRICSGLLTNGFLDTNVDTETTE